MNDRLELWLVPWLVLWSASWSVPSLLYTCAQREDSHNHLHRCILQHIHTASHLRLHCTLLQTACHSHGCRQCMNDRLVSWLVSWLERWLAPWLAPWSVP